MFIELSHTASENPASEGLPGISQFTNLKGMVCESVGPMRHEVSVPFHDSQVRGAAILIQTGWDQRWGTDASFEPGPFLGEHLIFRAIRSGVRLLGVDFPASDTASAETRLITTSKIPIVENLKDLASLPRVGFRFTALRLEGSLVRAIAEITR
jgi:kynurenine formamidase